MRIVSLFFVFGIMVTNVFSQNHASLKAVVVDSLNGRPIALATVSILRLIDTSLISYTTTDKNGFFRLYNLKEEPSLIIISHVGYLNLHLNVNLNKSKNLELGQLYLTQKMLQEVVVKAERIPIIIKKDTIEYDPLAFKTRPNALVEDLLKKLPGIQIDHNGSISLNGKQISKIKVDGKDFFATDPKIATRNLDADMIAKVQVYDDRENDPDHLLPEYEVKKIINLKFKKAFAKGSLSNFKAAAGTEKRYDSNIFSSLFIKDLQIAVIGNSNNLSGTGTLDNTYSSGNIVNSTTGSANFNNSFGETLKINGNYQYSKQLIDNNSKGRLQQLLGDTILNTSSLNLQKQGQNTQSLSIKAEWFPDSTITVRYEPDLTYSSTSQNNSTSETITNNYSSLLNSSINANYGSGSNSQYHHSLSYYQKLRKKYASISIFNTIDIHSQRGNNFINSNLLSYVAALQSDTLRRLAESINTGDNEALNVGLHFPFNYSFIGNISFSGTHDRTTGDVLSYEQDLKTGLYDIFLQDQSSNLIRDNWQQLLTSDLTWQLSSKNSLKLGLSAQWQQINNHLTNFSNDLKQKVFYFLPSLELRLNQIAFNYRKNITLPVIGDLQPIPIIYSPLLTFIGNPNLKPTSTHYISVNYSDYNSQSQLVLNVASNINIESNTVIRKRTISPEGAEVSTPINRDGKFGVSLNITAGKNFKKLNKWQINTSTSVNLLAGHTFFDVNGNNGYQNTTATTVNQEIKANWNDVFEIRCAYNVNYAVTKYQLVDLKSSAYAFQKAITSIDIFLPQKFTWSINDIYSYNPLVAPGFKQHSNLLNFSVGKRIQKKEKGELRITCYDLLNQSVNSTHFASENTINDIQYQPLKRYFLLTYTYRFNNFGR